MSEIIEVDARRLFCPLPVIRLQNTINKNPPGTRVRIVSTDPGSMNDIPTWCRINGHRTGSSYSWCRRAMNPDLLRLAAFVAAAPRGRYRRARAAGLWPPDCITPRRGDFYLHRGRRASSHGG
jgi:TusA-related sulfurtransferase